MDSYREFSYLYDSLMDDFDYEMWGTYIKEIFDKKGVEVKHILEMAIGTGNLTKELLKLGYFVDGFDISQDMLAIAANKIKNNKGSRLFNMDMRSFNMDKSYDAIVAACDSINYILEMAELEKTFKNVFDHLNPGGIFVFDVNSDFKLRKVLGNNIFLEDREEVFYTWENQLDEETGIVEFILTFFVTEDGVNYKRFDELHRERAYNANDIKSLLAKTENTNIDAYEAFSFDKYNENTERIIFVATK